MPHTQDQQEERLALRSGFHLERSRSFIVRDVISQGLPYVGEALTESNTKIVELSIKPELSEVPVQKDIHFVGFPKLVCQYRGSPQVHMKLVDGGLWFSAAQIKGLAVKGLQCINLVQFLDDTSFTLSSFPMNASIACTFAEGWLLVFRGNIWNGHT
jgi:hypothetical protein